MRTLLLLLAITPAASTLAQAGKMSATPASQIVIRADRILDGRGNVIRGGSVVVSGEKITKVNKTAGATATYDLKGMTLLPGLIDAHSHLTWYFNRNNRYHSRGEDNDTPVQSMLATAANALVVRGPGR